MANGSTVLQPDRDWITTYDAADRLCVDPRSLVRVCGQTLRRIQRNQNGRAPAGTGYLWWRADVEALASIRKDAHLSLNGSLRVMGAILCGDLDLSHLERRDFVCASGSAAPHSTVTT